MKLPVFPSLFLLAALILPLGPGNVANAQPNRIESHQIQEMAEIGTASVDGNEATLTFSLQVGEELRLPNRAGFNFWLTAPPGNTPRAEVTEATWWAVRNDGTRHGPFSLMDDGEYGRLPDAATRIRVAYVDSLRGFGLSRADFSPVYQTSRTHEGERASFTVLIEEATISVRIDGASRPDLPDEPLAQYDPYGLNMINHLAANAPQAESSYQAPQPLRNKQAVADWNEMLHEAASRGEAWFSRLPRPGLYRITGSTLRRFGIDPEAVPADRLRFFLAGEEVPVLAEGLEGGRLIGSASMTFHAHSMPEDRKPYIPLWILVAEEGAEPLRAELYRSTSRTGNVQPLRGTVRIDLFEPNDYNHMLPLHGPYLRWSTAVIPYQGFHEMEFELGEVPEGKETQFRFWLSNSQARAQTSFAFFVNGEKVHEGSTRGIRVQEETVNVATDLLRKGINTIALMNMEVEDASNVSTIHFLAARIRHATDSMGLLPHQVLQTERGANAETAVMLPDLGDGADGSLLADVTDPLRPVFSRLTTTRHGSGPAISTTTASEHENPSFVYAQGASYRRLRELQPVSPPRSFLDTDAVDYLVIYHDSLAGELGPLLEHRSRDRAVAAYPISDIYAAFSHGHVSYHAIKDALVHSFEHREGVRLQEVLLVGEGSEYWWELTHGRDDVTENMVPIHGWADPGVRIRGDDSYSTIAGEGPLSDLEIGRISVETPEELRDVVTKIIGYETNPPVGPWMTRHLFVSDEQPEFDRVTGEILDKSLDGPNIPHYFSLNEFPYEDYFRGFWRKRSTVMTDHLLEAWTQGARTITYMGHGGPNLWSGKRIFHIRDIDHLDTGGRHPLMVAGSCDTGWVDYPIDPVRASLAEQFLRKADGGVIAAYIPIHGTSSYEHNFLLTAFYQALFRDRIEDVGTLSLLSKVNYHLHRNNASVTNQYLLMGDPATRLAPEPETMPIEVDPGYLLTQTGGTVSVSGEAEGIEWGMAEITLLDQSAKILSSARARVTAGAFSGEIKVPSIMEPGDYRLIATAFSEGDRRQYVAWGNLPVLEIDVEVKWEMAAGEETLLPAGTNVDVALHLTNPTEFDIQRAIVQLRVMESGDELAVTPISIPAGETVTRQFSPALPSGLYTLEARVFSSTAEMEAGEEPLSAGTLRLRGTSEDVPLLAISPSEIDVRRVLERDGSRFSIRVYNMTHEELDGYQVFLRQVVGEQAVAISDPVDLPALPPGGNRTVEIVTNWRLDPGDTTFTLEVVEGGEESGELTEGQELNLVQRILFNETLKIGPDLEIVEDSLILENERPLAGETVFARFRVRNSGDTSIRRIQGRLYLHEPWVAENEVPNEVPWATNSEESTLHPGEEHEFRLRWDPAPNTPRLIRLYATVRALGGTVEGDMSNNVAHRDIILRDQPNMRIDLANVQRTHDFVRPWDRVRMSVPFVNDSDFDFVREFRVTAHAINVHGQRERLFSQRFDALHAGESGSLQFDWIVQPGQKTVEVNINEDREYLEETYDDNLAMFHFDYILEPNWFDEPARVWDFAGLPDLGGLGSVTRLPTGELTPVNRPSSTQVSRSFSETDVVEGRVGHYLDDDNRWGMYRDGLFLSYDETADPVRLRYPLREGYHTSLYDLYVSHIGNREPDLRSGHFRYRLAGQKDYTLHTPSGQGLEYLGRFLMRDQHLEIEVAAPPYPSQNHLFAFIARPVEGIYTSPIVQAERMPEGRLLGNATTPGDSFVRYGVRFGAGDTAGIEWGEWTHVEDGGLVPPAPDGHQFLQWNAFLVVGPEGALPRLAGVKIEMDAPEGHPTRIAARR